MLGANKSHTFARFATSFCMFCHVRYVNKQYPQEKTFLPSPTVYHAARQTATPSAKRRGRMCIGVQSVSALSNNWEIDRDMVMAGDYLAGRRSEHLNDIRRRDNLPYSVTPLYKPILDTDRSYMVNCTPLVCVRVVVAPSSLSFT